MISQPVPYPMDDTISMFYIPIVYAALNVKYVYFLDRFNRQRSITQTATLRAEMAELHDRCDDLEMQYGKLQMCIIAINAMIVLILWML